MNAARSYMTAADQPKWLQYSGRKVDVSDLWMEQVDPQNERGENCTAHIEWVDGPEPGGDLVAYFHGIEIEDATGTIYRGRDWCVTSFGADWVWNIERHEMEASL